MGSNGRRPKPLAGSLDDSPVDDELLLLAISLVKSTGNGSPPQFATQVALVFEALRKTRRG